MDSFGRGRHRHAVQIYRVVGVADGDTLTAVSGRRQIKYRLYGIDAPERHQAFGKRSKQALSDFCYGKDAALA